MKYMNIETGEYPISEADIKKRFPFTSFTSPFIPPENYVVVYSRNKPVVDPVTEYVLEAKPTFVDGAYYQSWSINEYTQEQIDKNRNELIKKESDLARSNRSHLLAESDWTQGKDIADEISQKWQPYRQALRDITSQPGFPLDIIWPQKPE